MMIKIASNRRHMGLTFELAGDVISLARHSAGGTN